MGCGVQPGAAGWGPVLCLHAEGSWPGEMPTYERELVSPTSWQGGSCFLFSCLGRQGGALFPAVGCTVQGEGWATKVSSGSDVGRELGSERSLLLLLLLVLWGSSGSWSGPSRKLVWPMASDLTTANTVVIKRTYT